MSCLSFSNNYFDKAVAVVRGSFTRDIRNVYFKNSLEGCFGNLNLIYIERNGKELKVQSCKLYNNKYMIASTQKTNTDIFVFIAVLVFQLLSRKVLFINRKGNKNC